MLRVSRPRDSERHNIGSQTDIHTNQRMLLLQTALDLSRDVVFFVEPRELTIIDANRAASELLGYCKQSITTLALNSVAPNITAQDVKSLCHNAPQHAPVACTTLRRRNGQPVPVEIRACAVDAGSQSLLIVVAQTTEQTLHRDSLTGLPTREAVDRRLQKIFDAPAAQCAVFFFDIDQFKQINDRYGHWAGDRVLKATAERLANCLRGEDLAARYGGDELIAVVTHATRKTDIVHIAARFRTLMKSPIHAQPHWLHATASAGVAFSLDYRSPEALLRAADRALYRAKAHGRDGRFVFETHRERQKRIATSG